MEIVVWTKQHISVWQDIHRTGRYVARRDRIKLDMGDQADLILLAYDWLVEQISDDNKPADAAYPIWLSPSREATMMISPDWVILELAIAPDQMTKININKWGAILNFSYLPLDEADAKRHRQRLNLYGLSDAQVVMSRFYPELRQEIIDSWSRLFDDTISLGNDQYYGLIWEVKKEWIRQIIR